MERPPPPSPKKIGLIGGLAVRAGVFYYEQLCRRFAADTKALRLTLSHADVGTVLALVAAGDKAGLGSYLASFADELAAAGADVVAITAVAPHLAIDEVVRSARCPLVNLLELIPAGLAGYGRVAVFGNRAVMQTNLFGTLSPAQVVELRPSVLEQVHAAYTDIALHGKRGTPAETRLLEEVARNLIDRGGAQAILLAGTDLSSFYAEQPPGYPFVDAARLHIDEIVRRAGSVTA